MFLEAVAAVLVPFFGYYVYWMTVVVPNDLTDNEADTIASGKGSSEGQTKKDTDGVIVDMVDGCTSTVILLGWAGCRDRYLSKYAQYYKQAGISTIRFTAPIAKIRSFSSYRVFAKAFLKKVEMTVGKDHLGQRLFFQVFSMNGCSLFAALWDILGSEGDQLDIKKRSKGLIFDSCPAFTSPSQSAQAISFATLPPKQYPGALRESYRAVLFAFFSFHKGVMWFRSLYDKDIYEKHYAYFKMITFNDLPTKQLYIFGPADLVCSEESILAYFNEMESRGLELSKLRLLDSPHCQHLRTHPTVYKEECIQFVKSGILPENHSRVDLETAIEDNEDQPAELSY